MLLLLSEITDHSPVCWGGGLRADQGAELLAQRPHFYAAAVTPNSTFCDSHFPHLRSGLKRFLSDIVCGEWETSLREPTLHSWKFSDTSVSWMSISLGVGAAVGVPAALPHDGDPIVPPGEEVVKPSNTLRNFFISFSFFNLPTCFPGLCRSV